MYFYSRKKYTWSLTISSAIYLPALIVFQVVTANNMTWENCKDISIFEGPLSKRKPIANCSISQDSDNTSISYSLLFNYNGIFSIDSITGTVYQETEVDREKRNHFAVYIRALNITTSFNVTVEDVNDNAPEILGNKTIKTITFLDIQAKMTDFYQVMAVDQDSGKNAELNFAMTYSRHFIRELGEIVMFQINVSDNGNPKLSTSAIKRVDIVGRCPQQQHTINASNGIITSYLLCDVELLPNINSIFVGDSFTLSCQYVSNLKNVQFVFIGGVNNVSVVTMESVLNVTNVSLDWMGLHTCIAKTSIGELQSNAIQLVVMGKFFSKRI